MTSPLVAAALDYATRGWPVLPLHWPANGACSCPRKRQCSRAAKHPTTPHGKDDATLDPETITAWWRRWPDANIGLRTGIAFDVLDLDGDQALDGLDAAAPPGAGTIVGPIVATGKGVHIYVGVTGAGNRSGERSGLPPGIDWRGGGGYVVAPPSAHITGRRYTWGAGYGPDHPIEPCPNWLAAIVKRDAGLSLRAIASATGADTKTVQKDIRGVGDSHTSPDDEPKTVTGADGKTYAANRPKLAHRWAQTALDAETGKVALAPEGARNHTLNVAAFSLGQIVAAGHLDPADVAARLLTAAARAGLTEGEAVATIASGLRAGVRTPRAAS